MKEKIKEVLKSQRKHIAILIICSISVFIFNIIKPLFNSNLIDKGLMELNLEITLNLSIILVIFVVFDKLIGYIQTKVETNIKQFVEYKLKIDIFEHAIKLKNCYYKELGFFKILSDAYWDLDNILMIIENNFLTVFTLFLKAIGATVALFLLNIRLAIVILCCIPIKYLISHIISKYIVEKNAALLSINQDYNSWFEDTVEGIMEIKLWNLGKIKRKELGDFINKQNNIEKEIALLRTEKFSIDSLIDESLTFILYALGLYMVLTSEITVGNVITIAYYSGYLLAPVNVILNLRQTLDEIKPAIDNINCFFEMKEEQTGKLAMPEMIHKLEFKNVSFKTDSKVILEEFNAIIKKGQKIAIVGENGTGKSTLLNLLLRIEEPTEGTITINDIPIQKFDLISYRSAFSTLMQNVNLFTGSVESNIFIDEYCSSDRQYSELREKFYWIYNKEIDEIGDIGQGCKKLSGGERQKIAYLRAISNKRQFIIMDEPTSAFDDDSIAKFCDYICTNAEFDFYIIVTHDKRLLRFVDKVLELERK